MRLAIPFGLLILLTGCAHYEYNIVSPDNLRGHIGQNTDRLVRLEPLEYRFRSVDNHLVARIYNRGSDPVQLLGDQSVVVAPNGESHPLRSQTIAPGSFIKLIFPPIPPQTVPTGPVIGIGFGARVDRTPPGTGIGHGPGSESVRYLDAYAPDGALYWDWTDQAEVTVTFVYRQRDHIFRQQFVFGRQKR